MYNERNDGFSIKGIIAQILLVVLFVALMIWLFPTKGYIKKTTGAGSDLNPVLEQVFTNNLNNMKEAATSYFTTARLPKKVGDSVSMTLGDMIDKKLILSFVDGNNKTCDLKDSYVKLTKYEDEYQMKVQLSCSNQSDYIIAYMGCYDYCEGSICEAKDKETELSYKYKLVTNGGYSAWSAWSTWSTTKKEKNNLTEVETKTEKTITGYEQVYTYLGTKNKTYWSYEIVGYNSGTSSTVTDTKTAVWVAGNSSETYSDWVSAGTVKTTNNTLVSTETERYTLRSTEDVLDCSNSCRTNTVRIYAKETRTKSNSSTNGYYSCSSYGANYKLNGTKCELKVTVTSESTPVYDYVSRTKQVAQYGYVNGDPIYKEVTYYRYRTRTYTASGTTYYKWSTSSNDKTLINKGYKLVSEATK